MDEETGDAFYLHIYVKYGIMTLLMAGNGRMAIIP